MFILLICILHLSLSTLQVAHAEMAFVPKTGQTTSYTPGDDGALQEGVPWPNPRFTDNVNGTMTDNLTGLVWLKNANCFGLNLWATAIASANALSNGSCGLSDGSIAGTWRLPNRKELKSLVNRQQANPAMWLNGQGFTSVQSYFYWSSSTSADSPGSAFYVNMNYGYLGGDIKGNIFNVWPVHSEQ